MSYPGNAAECKAQCPWTQPIEPAAPTTLRRRCNQKSRPGSGEASYSTGSETVARLTACPDTNVHSNRTTDPDGMTVASIHGLPVYVALRGDFEGVPVAVRSALISRAVEVALAVGGQIAERVEAVGASGKDVQLVVGPGIAGKCEFVNRSCVVRSIAVRGGKDLAGFQQKIAEAAGNAP